MFLFYTGLHWYFVGWSRIQILNQISTISIWWSEFTEADLSTGSPSLKYLATKTYYWKRKRKLFLVGSSSVGRLNLPPTQPYPIPRLASRHQTFQKNGNNPINNQHRMKCEKLSLHGEHFTNKMITSLGGLTPDICQFWHTIAWSRPKKVNKKVQKFATKQPKLTWKKYTSDLYQLWAALFQAWLVDNADCRVSGKSVSSGKSEPDWDASAIGSQTNFIIMVSTFFLQPARKLIIVQILCRMKTRPDQTFLGGSDWLAKS